MPSSLMLQPNRLENLMKQALAMQVHNCKYHNVYQSEYSLLEDHHCSKLMIPSKCIAVLKGRHKDEVWNVKFSPSGNRLASVGKDHFVYIWSFQKIPIVQSSQFTSQMNSQSQLCKYKIKCTHEIHGHSKNILALNWTNTDDRWVITAGSEGIAKVWDSKSG